jgi:hypothetical protein
MYEEPYQPMSERELKASVMRGTAVARIVLSWKWVLVRLMEGMEGDVRGRRETWICRGRT